MSRSIRKTTSRQLRRPSSGDCEIEILSRIAAGGPIGTSLVGIHDVVKIHNWNGNVTGRACRTTDDGCGGVTCNDEGVGDGCPSDPAKDARDPYHDTMRTWTRRMDQGACNACAVAYDRAIGYAYRLGDSNGAVMDCIRAAKRAGMPGRRPSYFRFAPVLEADVPRWPLLCPGPREVTGRALHRRDQVARRLRWARAERVSQHLRSGHKGSQTVHLVSLEPECQQGCTPSTSRSQAGAQCGAIWNGCEQESCPSYCAPYQECAGTQCCTRAQGNCDWAYDECAQQYVYLGTCGYSEVCENNWCVNDPCVADPCCCGDWSCQNDVYNWCVTHGWDHQCCWYLPLASQSPEAAVCTGRGSSAAGR